jgi:hypothetical protein
MCAFTLVSHSRFVQASFVPASFVQSRHVQATFISQVKWCDVPRQEELCPLTDVQSSRVAR